LGLSFTPREKCHVWCDKPAADHPQAMGTIRLCFQNVLQNKSLITNSSSRTFVHSDGVTFKIKLLKDWFRSKHALDELVLSVREHFATESVQYSGTVDKEKAMIIFFVFFNLHYIPSFLFLYFKFISSVLLSFSRLNFFLIVVPIAFFSSLLILSFCNFPYPLSFFVFIIYLLVLLIHSSMYLCICL
jgi:hypothetical protein